MRRNVARQRGSVTLDGSRSDPLRIARCALRENENANVDPLCCDTRARSRTRHIALEWGTPSGGASGTHGQGAGRAWLNVEPHMGHAAADELVANLRARVCARARVCVRVCACVGPPPSLPDVGALLIYGSSHGRALNRSGTAPAVRLAVLGSVLALRWRPAGQRTLRWQRCRGRARGGPAKESRHAVCAL